MKVSRFIILITPTTCMHKDYAIVHAQYTINSPAVLDQEKHYQHQAQVLAVRQPLVTLVLSLFHLTIRWLSLWEQWSRPFWR